MSQVFVKGLTKNLSKFNSIFANKSFVRSLCNVTIGKDGLIVSKFMKIVLVTLQVVVVVVNFKAYGSVLKELFDFM